jgi:hypothetical protein
VAADIGEYRPAPKPAITRDSNRNASEVATALRALPTVKTASADSRTTRIGLPVTRVAAIGERSA